MNTFPLPRPGEATQPKDARANQIQVIARAAAVLRSLEDEERGLSLGQIATRVGLARSTVQRIVAALEAEQLVIVSAAAGGIRLGPALLRLAASVNTSAAETAKPLIAKLSAALMETVDLSVPKRDHLVFIDQVVGSQRLRTVSSVGEAFPLSCTANGKAFLATLSNEEVIRRIGQDYEPRTPKTLTSFTALKADLAKTRARGYALDAEEHALGITAVGILVYDMLGNPLMISVPVPTARFEQHRNDIIRQLLETKQLLQERFGEDR
jgi:DNA-binding IclR family transcriptional regulator